MHIADLKSGNIGANGVVAGGYPLSCGAALSQKYNKTGRVVLCFAGDGSTNEGNFHEALNLASVWKLPVIFFIENNGYAMSTPIEEHMNIENIAERAVSYGIPGMTIDGNNVLEVFEITKKAAEFARSGKGPVLIESLTYRYNGHSKSDRQLYRTQEEVAEWKKKDPILRLRGYLLGHELFSEEDLVHLEKGAKESVEYAAKYALHSPEPSLDTLLKDIYDQGGMA